MRFSIIIPTFNRPNDLDRCLSAITRLEYPRDQFEVIVVDDGGHLDLEPITARYSTQIQLTLLRQTNRGCGAARNKGTEHACGTWLAFTDDDCTPVPDWLTALDAAATRVPDALIGGNVANGVPNNIYSAAGQAISDYFRAHMNRDAEHGRFCSANNFAVPAGSYSKIGGFDASFTRAAAEDRDFCDRWLSAGLRIIFASNALVLHHRDMSFRSFWHHYFQYGRGAFVFAQTRLRRNAGRVSFEGLGFHLGLIMAPVRKSLRPRSVYLSLLIVVEQIAYAMGYAYAARASQSRSRYSAGRDDEAAPSDAKP